MGRKHISISLDLCILPRRTACIYIHVILYICISISVSISLSFFLSAFVSLRFCVLFIVPTHVYLLLSLFVFPACSHTAHLHDSLHLPPSLLLSLAHSLCACARRSVAITHLGVLDLGGSIEFGHNYFKEFLGFYHRDRCIWEVWSQNPPKYAHVYACACVCMRGCSNFAVWFFLSLPHFVYLFIPLLSISLSVMMVVHSEQ